MKRQVTLKTKIQFIIWITTIIIFTQSCSISSINKPTIANKKEMIIIDKMSCWNSVSAESVMLRSAFSEDQNEKDKLIKDWSKYIEEAQIFGRESLSNDTIFISCLRSDSLYQSILLKRKKLVESLIKFENKFPIFKSNIKKISTEIIEYKYSNSEDFGIYETSYIQESIINNQSYYSNYTELLKEAYSQNKTNNISDEDIRNLSGILREIEKIDRHIWCMPYYVESKNKYQEENSAQERNKKFDSLTK